MQRGRVRAKLAPGDAGVRSAPASRCRLALPQPPKRFFSGSVLFETHGGFMPGVLGWCLSCPTLEHRLGACAGSAEGGLGMWDVLHSFPARCCGSPHPPSRCSARLLLLGLLRHGADWFLELFSGSCCLGAWV